MLGKLLLIILTAALTAAALLVIRQQRIDTAHRMSIAHQRMVDSQRALWKMQCEIAAQCRPEQVRQMMEQLDEKWTTIPDPETVRETVDFRVMAPLVVDFEDERQGG